MKDEDLYITSTIFIYIVRICIMSQLFIFEPELQIKNNA